MFAKAKIFEWNIEHNAKNFKNLTKARFKHFPHVTLFDKMTFSIKRNSKIQYVSDVL